MEFVVVVGGAGASYTGPNRRRAMRAFRRSVELCLSRRAGRGTVTLFAGGVPVREYDGEFVRRGARVG